MFEIGDKIKCIRNYYGGGDCIRRGETGTIVVIDKDMGETWVGIYLDGYKPSRHELDGNCEDGHGWWVFDYDITEGIYFEVIGG